MITSADDGSRLYGRSFYLVFAALLAFMAGYNMLLHLPKYVERLGGDIKAITGVFALGWAGSLLARPFLGRWVDRIGSRPVLVIAALAAAGVALAFPQCERMQMMYLLRCALQVSMAAYLTSIAVLAARIAPAGRSAESLAMIGVGGLLGMMFGPLLGDAILPRDASLTTFRYFFLLAMVLLAVSGGLILLVPERYSTPQPLGTREGFLRIAWRHRPGPIMLVAICLACAQTVPVMLIERFVTYRGIDHVTMFFLAYSPTAVVLRLLLRRLPAHIGRRRTLLMGMSCYVVAWLLLIPVDQQVWLLLPAIIGGAGHCFSYPFLVDLAADRMPAEHRGLATSMILAATDVGYLVGFFVWGRLVDAYGFSVTLAVIAATCAAGTGYWAWTERALLRRRPLPRCTGEPA